MTDDRNTPWMEEDFPLLDDGSADPFSEQPEFKNEEDVKTQEEEENGGDPEYERFLFG